MLTPLVTFALPVRRLLLPRPLTLLLLPLFPLGVPLSGLQHQHSHQDERQYGIAGCHHFQTVISPKELLRSRFRPLHTDG